MEEANAARLRFIIDHPADSDFFNTHTPVAKAITQSIIENSAIKIIGLLGRWGSGKSTIVRQVARELDEHSDRYVTFAYDAWLHQTDPLRRSFLESLVDYLKERDLVSLDEWTKEIKQLKGASDNTDILETPILTDEAKLLFFLALPIPLGASFLGRDTFSAALGSSSTTAGIWTFILALGLIFIPISIWLLRYLYGTLNDESPSLFPAMLLNKNLVHRTIQTQRSPEPTSIEFGAAFQRLMLEVQTKQKRVVIVIDNMDRIDEKEAMQLWASIRSFFLATGDQNQIDHESYHPIVILPIDSQALSQLFSMGNDIDGKKAKSLAMSFVNKTFDVTFDVPPPIMSDWKRYLGDKMRFCFGDGFSDIRYFRVRQFLETWFNRSGTSVTPREINKILNRIVSASMQNPDREIDFDVIAYYAINKNEITDITAEVLIENHPLGKLVSDWQGKISALFYGVKVPDAAQILMTDPIKRSILLGSDKLIIPYKDFNGFGDIFHSVTENLPSDANRPAPDLEVITNAGRILVDLNIDTVLTESSWRNLTRSLIEVEKGGEKIADLSERLLPFFDHLTEQEVPGFIGLLERIGDRVLSQNATKEMLIEIGKLGEKGITLGATIDRRPIYDSTKPAEDYLDVLIGLSEFPNMQGRTRGDASHEDLISDIQRRMRDPALANDAPHLVSLLTSDAAKFIIKSPLQGSDLFLTTAEELIRSQPGDSILYRVAVQVCASFPAKDVSSKELLGRLAKEGILVNQLASVAEQNDDATLAPMLATLVWQKIDLSSTSAQVCEKAFKDKPNLAESVNKYLDNLPMNIIAIDAIREFYSSIYWNRDTASTLLTDRVKRSNLGTLNSASVISNLSAYSSILPYSLRQRFAEQLTSYRKFWPNIQGLPWSTGLVDAALLLIRKDGEAAEKVRAELTDRMNKAPSSDWVSAILTGAEPYRAAKEVALDFKAGAGSELQSALLTTAASADLNSKDARSRWFTLAESLSTPARKKAMEALAEALVTRTPTDRLALLKAGGPQFLQESGIKSQAARTLTDIIIPLSKSEKGRAWLKDRSKDFKTTIAKLTDPEIALLEGALAQLVKSSNEERKHWALMMRNSWRID